MKNKKSLYFLAPAVLLIWALIIYRVSDGLQAGNSYYSGTGLAVGEQVAAGIDSFRYVLRLDYPDPFLGKPQPSAQPTTQLTSTPVQPPASVHALQPQPKQEPQPQVDFSRYKYIGLVEHKGKKDRIALISIDGRSIMVREGEAIEEIQLLKIAKDSVQLKSGNLRFYVRK